MPAHAQTTDDSDAAPAAVTTPAPVTHFYGQFDMVEQTTDSSSPASRLLSILVPEDHAGFSVSMGEMCIDTSKAPTFSATVSLGNGKIAGLYTTTTGVIDGPPVQLDFVPGPCKFNQTGVTLQVSSPTSGGAPHTITAAAGNRFATGTLPEGMDCPEQYTGCL